jgi:MarR family transcriptional regulator, 2-MHQ and catechol-resistance regulon repressor
VRIDRRESLYDELLRKITLTRSEFDREAIAASVNLALTCDVHQVFLFRRLGEHGLARSSFNLLALLRHAHPEGLQLSEIGTLLITSRANITGLVDHLEEKGYVKRVVSTHDRRARLAKLTKRGEALIDELMPAHQNRSSAFFSTLSPSEVRQLTKLLKKLRQSPAVRQAEEESTSIFNPSQAAGTAKAESGPYGEPSGLL